MDFTLDSIPVADPQISCLKSKRFHEITQFHEIHWISWLKPLNQIIEKNLHFHRVHTEPVS